MVFFIFIPTIKICTCILGCGYYTDCPWTSDFYKGSVNYEKGICPNAETLQDNMYLGLAMCLNDLSEFDIESIISAFKKVWSQLDSLKANSK